MLFSPSKQNKINICYKTILESTLLINLYFYRELGLQNVTTVRGSSELNSWRCVGSTRVNTLLAVFNPSDIHCESY